MLELGIGNISDISINRITNTIMILSNNIIYIITPNQVNEQYYTLINQLKTPIYTLTDDLGRVMNVYTTELKITEDAGHSINKPYYKLDIKCVVVPK
jgi:hypothetical protein